MADGTRDLTKGPVWRGLAAVSAPMTLGIAAVLSIGLADAYFLGQLGGDPLAAVGYIFPVITAVSSLSIGLSAGTNAAVSQAIGRRAGRGEQRRLALHAVALGVGLACAVALAMFALHRPLFRLIGATDPVMTEIALFMPWWCASFPFLVALMQLQAVFRAHGRGAVAASVMTVAAAMNIGLDPVLIFGLWRLPELGTEGAALATFTARVIAVGGAFAYGVARGYLRLTDRPGRDVGGSLRVIAGVGGPAALSNAVNPAGMAAVTAAVSTVGETAVAGFGAATRVQSLALVPMLALSAGIGPVVGQNWGARRSDRAARGLAFCFLFCLCYGVAVGLLLWVFARPIAGGIANGTEATAFGAQYLRIVGWSLIGYGFVVTANAAMNARSRPLWSLSLSLARIGLLYLPLAWLGVSVVGYSGILWAAVAANAGGAAGAVLAGWRTGLLRADPRCWPLPGPVRARRRTGARS